MIAQLFSSADIYISVTGDEVLSLFPEETRLIDRKNLARRRALEARLSHNGRETRTGVLLEFTDEITDFEVQITPTGERHWERVESMRIRLGYSSYQQLALGGEVVRPYDEDHRVRIRMGLSR